MSINLIVEVLDNAPDDLSSGERLVLIVIAEWANDKTRIARQTHNWDLDTICRRAGVKRSGLKSVFQGLARKGLEVRVPIKHDKAGKPVFAHEGKAMTFKVPPLPQRGGYSLPTERGGSDHPSDPQEGMPQHPRGEAVASERGGHSLPHPLKVLPSKRTPHLSLDVAVEPADSSVLVEDRERDESASLPKPQPQSVAHTILAKHDCTGTEADTVIAYANRDTVKGPGWWCKLDSNDGHIPALVAEFRATTTTVASCTTCNDTGSTGDWMNPRPCDCLWWKNPAAARKAFIAQLDGFPPCEHGTNGGDLEAPNGWQHCSMCRGPGWTDPPAPVEVVNVQPRSALRRSNQHVPYLDPPDTSAYYTSTLYPREVRSPADQRVADAGPLYAKYKAIEEGTA